MWEGQWNTWPAEYFNNVRIKAPNVASCQKVCQSSKRAAFNGHNNEHLTPVCKGWNFDFDTLSCYIFNHRGYTMVHYKYGYDVKIQSSVRWYKVQNHAWGYSGYFNKMYGGPKYCP